MSNFGEIFTRLTASGNFMVAGVGLVIMTNTSPHDPNFYFGMAMAGMGVHLLAICPDPEYKKPKK